MKITGRETVWEGRFLRAVVISYEDHNGAARQWEAVERSGADGVVIMVPVTACGDVVLIKQFRPVLGCHVVELPAGLVSPGEDIIAAARRELIEETRHDAERFLPMTSGVMSTGINSEIWHAVLAQNASEAGEALAARHLPDDTECIEVLRVPLGSLYESLREMERAGQRVDIRIYGLVELARHMMEER